jgi:hypothetical protein
MKCGRKSGSEGSMKRGRMKDGKHESMEGK